MRRPRDELTDWIGHIAANHPDVLHQRSTSTMRRDGPEPPGPPRTRVHGADDAAVHVPDGRVDRAHRRRGHAVSVCGIRRRTWWRSCRMAQVRETSVCTDPWRGSRGWAGDDHAKQCGPGGRPRRRTSRPSRERGRLERARAGIRHVRPGASGFLEGISFDKTGNGYVSMIFLGQIRRISPDGSQSVVATIPAPASESRAWRTRRGVTCTSPSPRWT
jgi:hypothetical protein